MTCSPNPRQANWEDLKAELRNTELAVRRYDTKSLQRILLRLVPELAKTSVTVEPAEVIPISRSS